MDLDVLVHHEIDHLAAGDLQDRRFDRELFERCQHGVALVRAIHGRVDEAGRAIEHGLDRVLANHHFGKLVLYRAKARDRLAELLPLGGIRGGLADDPAGSAAAHRPELEPAVVEHVEGDLVALADLPEDVPGRHPNVLENQRRRR